MPDRSNSIIVRINPHEPAGQGIARNLCPETDDYGTKPDCSRIAKSLSRLSRIVGYKTSAVPGRFLRNCTAAAADSHGCLSEICLHSLDDLAHVQRLP